MKNGLCNQLVLFSCGEAFAPFTGAGEADKGGVAGEAFSDTVFWLYSEVRSQIIVY